MAALAYVPINSPALKLSVANSASAASAGSVGVSSAITRTPAARAFLIAGTIALVSLGVMRIAFAPAATMFSSAVIWLALSPSNRPAAVISLAFLVAAACAAPSRIFTKKGFVSVLVMSPMIGCCCECTGTTADARANARTNRVERIRMRDPVSPAAHRSPGRTGRPAGLAHGRPVARSIIRAEPCRGPKNKLRTVLRHALPSVSGRGQVNRWKQSANEEHRPLAVLRVVAGDRPGVPRCSAAGPRCLDSPGRRRRTSGAHAAEHLRWCVKGLHRRSQRKRRGVLRLRQRWGRRCADRQRLDAGEHEAGWRPAAGTVSQRRKGPLCRRDRREQARRPRLGNGNVYRRLRQRWLSGHLRHRFWSEHARPQQRRRHLYRCHLEGRRR